MGTKNAKRKYGERSKVKIKEKTTAKTTSLNVVIHRKDMYLGGVMLASILLILALQMLMFPPKQTLNGVIEPSIDPNATIVYAGYVRSNGSLGNSEGFQPGLVVKYGLPPNINAGNLIFVGSWRNDPMAMVHVGDSQGFAFFGFEDAEYVSMVASSLVPALVLVFFDNGYVPKELAGKDVEIAGGRSYIVVQPKKSYELVHHGPKGPHLVSIATKVENVSLNWISKK